MVPQILNTILLGSVFSKREQWWQETGRSPMRLIDRMARELEIGRWCMRFALYGDEAVVDHRFAKIKAAFERDRQRRGVGNQVRAGGHPEPRAPGRAHPGRRPQPRAEQDDGWYGGEEGGHIGFSPVAPMTGRDGLALRDLLRGMIEEAGLDYMAGLDPR